jgi:hypothetical protein
MEIYEGELKFEGWSEWKPILINIDDARIEFRGYTIDEYTPATIRSWMMDNIAYGCLRIRRYDNMSPMRKIKTHDMMTV